MLDETLSVVSIWTSVNSWLTPAVLFVVLNLVIGTIAFTSGLSSSSPKPHSSPSNPHAPQPLPRSPSVLHRLRSIKLYRSEPPSSDSVYFRPSEHSVPDSVPDPTPIPLKVENAVHEEEVTPIQEEEVEEEPEGLEGPTMEQVFSQIQKGASVYGRSKSDGGYTAAPEKSRRRIIQKAASDISSTFGQFQPSVQPDSVVLTEHEDEYQEGEEVDGKAEDFINRFRQQLNMQRMESLYRAAA